MSPILPVMIVGFIVAILGLLSALRERKKSYREKVMLFSRTFYDVCDKIRDQKIDVTIGNLNGGPDYFIAESNIKVCDGLYISMRAAIWKSVSHTESDYDATRVGCIRFYAHYPDTVIAEPVRDVYEDLDLLPSGMILNDIIKVGTEKLATDVAHAVRVLDSIWHQAQQYESEFQKHEGELLKLRHDILRIAEPFTQPR